MREQLTTLKPIVRPVVQDFSGSFISLLIGLKTKPNKRGFATKRGSLDQAQSHQNAHHIIDPANLCILHN
jgi:hypothetical protein